MLRKLRVWETPGAVFERDFSDIAVLPVGSLERHGDHLPLGTDTLEALYVAERVSEELSASLYPPIWYGSSISLRSFRGTIDVDPDSFYRYVKSVLREISRNGHRVIVVINGHGGNSDILREAARELSHETESHYIVIDWWRDVAQETRMRLFEAPGHAGEDETSAMLYIAPETVDMSLAERHVVERPRIAVYSKVLDKRLYPRALLGDATRGDREKGRIWIETAVKEIVALVREILNNVG